MKRGLTPAGIGKVDSVASFAKLAGEAGFSAIDCGGDQLLEWVKRDGLDEVRKTLSDAGVEIGAIGLAVDWRTTETAFRESLERFVPEARVAAELGCKACCTYILPSTDENPARFLAVATNRLRTCASVLNAYGMRLGLEFVGPHHLRTQWKHPFIQDMESTLAWIEAIQATNVGLLLDVYHWYTTESGPDDLMQLDPGKIVHVHINDAKDVPVSEAHDQDRLYPGEGVIDVKGFLQALRKIGYHGIVSQEVLTPEPPKEDPLELVTKSARAFDRVWPI